MDRNGEDLLAARGREAGRRLLAGGAMATQRGRARIVQCALGSVGDRTGCVGGNPESHSLGIELAIDKSQGVAGDIQLDLAQRGHARSKKQAGLAAIVCRRAPIASVLQRLPTAVVKGGHLALAWELDRGASYVRQDAALVLRGEAAGALLLDGAAGNVSGDGNPALAR